MIFAAPLPCLLPSPKTLMLGHHLRLKVRHDSTHMSLRRYWKKSRKPSETELRTGMVWISTGQKVPSNSSCYLLKHDRFGKLRLYGTIRVGKDKQSWQELECFLFAEMLICVKEKKVALPQQWDDPNPGRKTTRCTLKGSILIKKHLNEVTE